VIEKASHEFKKIQRFIFLQCLNNFFLQNQLFLTRPKGLVLYLNKNSFGGKALKEITLRKWHRLSGIVLSLFIVIQAGTGLTMTFIELGKSSKVHANSEYEKDSEHKHESRFEEALEFIHKKGGIIGNIYRLAVSLGLIGMVGSGALIFFKIQVRQKRKRI